VSNCEQTAPTLTCYVRFRETRFQGVRGRTRAAGHPLIHRSGTSATPPDWPFCASLEVWISRRARHQGTGTRLRYEENDLKANTNDKEKAKFRESNGETHENLRKLTSDPTLEGRDENKVGRIERKLDRTSEKALEK
jgi:hypothetical protein